MDDSGIESDIKPGFCTELQSGMEATAPDVSLEKAPLPSNNGKLKNVPLESSDEEIDTTIRTEANNSKEKSLPPVKAKNETLHLQKKLAKQIEQAKHNRVVEKQPKKSLISYKRLPVPQDSSHPLVAWESDTDEESDFHPLSNSAQQEITKQLIKDGYHLDTTPDDEDLDLIPPQQLRRVTCSCCRPDAICALF